MRSARRHIPLPPRSLALLLAVVAVIGIGWALIVPPWQSPDEFDHFAYTQSLAENFSLPGNPHRQDDASDESTASTAVGAYATSFFPSSVPPQWDPATERAYLQAENGPHPPSRSDGGGPNGAESNPPLYYLYADIAYLADHDGTAFGRLYLTQLWGVMLLIGTTIGAWLLAGEVFGRRRVLQLCCAAVTALLPMATFMSTSVNPDALLIMLWTFALWLGVRVIDRGANGRDVAALCAVIAAGILTKATSYALVGPAAIAVLLGVMRRPAGTRRRGLLVSGAASLLLVVPVVGWLWFAHHLGRAGINAVGPSNTHPPNLVNFLNYVWQFYLPRLPFAAPARVTGGLPAYDIWFKGALGEFGWLDVPLPGWVYAFAAAVTAFVIAWAIVIIARSWSRRIREIAGFFALTVVALLVLLHVSAYLLAIVGGGEFLQGRYLLPLLGLVGLTVALVVRSIPPGGRTVAATGILVGLLVLQAIALSSVIHVYYG